MKRMIALTVIILITLFAFTNAPAEQKKVHGYCTLPPDTPGIEVEVIYYGQTVASDLTDSAGYYYINGVGLVTDRAYDFYATNGVGEHWWNFTYNGGTIRHDFALGVMK